MKRISVLCLLASIICFCFGCSTQKNLTNLAKALAKDPATVNINLSSIYGTLRFERFVPNTNTIAIPNPAMMPVWFGNGPWLQMQSQAQPIPVMPLVPAAGLFWTAPTNFQASPK